jgi:hypothetical protein
VSRLARIVCERKNTRDASSGSEGISNLKYPPFFADVEISGARHPELRIDGYAGAKKILSRSFSANPAYDRLSFQCDDSEILRMAQARYCSFSVL